MPNIALCVDYIPKFNKLPMSQKNLAVAISGFKSVHSLLKSKYMSRYRYNKFLEFYYKVSKDKKSNNTIGLPSEYDIYQLKHYLTSLNNWIDSEEYSMATSAVRKKIISEQKRIYKQINLI